jgi:hypothetical protein
MNRVFKKNTLYLYFASIGSSYIYLIYKTADYEVGVSSKFQKKHSGRWRVRVFEKKKNKASSAIYAYTLSNNRLIPILHSTTHPHSSLLGLVTQEPQTRATICL